MNLWLALIKGRFVLFIVSLILLGSLPLFAQEPQETQDASPPRSFVVFASTSMDSIWFDSLWYNLGRLSRLRELYRWVPGKKSEAESAATTDDRPDVNLAIGESEVQACRRWAALHDYSFILVLQREADTGPELVRISYRVVDVISGQERLSGILEDQIPNERDLQEIFWLPLMAELDTLEAQKNVGLLTVRALPGTKVIGLGSDLPLIDESGEAIVQITIPGTYRWKAIVGGMATASGIISLRESPAELNISQRQSSSWTLEAGALMGQFGDFWVSKLFAKEQYWLGFGLQQYWIGINYPSPEDPFPYSQPVISLPMIQPGLSLGYRFFDDTSFLRPYLSALIMARLNTSLMMLDPVAPMVIYGNGGLEWRLFRSVAFFAETSTAYYPLSMGRFLAASKVGINRALSNYLFAEDWFLEFPIFRLGVRYFL
ncbi:hypothetical protein [Gracilinema caldarium]|uniref:hypothetical protein n=1 Tax=Gracilinema caldarium TaxID=215591 RepID=UPI0026F225BE|nr:hypothetical protein [Gracilinema caldarium]